MHPRNKHQQGYDFARLCQVNPALTQHLRNNPHGDDTIDFSDRVAVVALNQALLASDYGIKLWQLPEPFLCPPVPGRADYIHALADLLADDNQGEIPTGKQIRCLDIGTGANLIYPLIGQAEYGWQFTGSDINPMAVSVAQTIAKANGLGIKIKQQKDQLAIFHGIINAKDTYHLTMCNPPFHESEQAAQAGTARKWRNLGKSQKTGQLNFGGHAPELWCPGGELAFIKSMIHESQDFAGQVGWFTSLVSKKDNLPALKKALQAVKASEVKVIDMHQGQKVSRFIAWCF
ncbi:23S rRNA (adenine(1618)-N(6))-methyltransferase RlmF [Pseudoalteromonas ardens]|uniref:Ribosomal RNA large subunit methyltransferase F n=1 Tax=Pseudoalteromonas rubra TaxID=43658 RepID=A0A0L0ER43_9GAMM|nr:23S rRNA (adenine(1618)-N(6))-methyltransferase RlmF [Pseudoalteromonas sp. R96]KNC66874.1 23S rRNA methyltransferase [Pseudoalteromonas rubra]MDK1309867.1 23S rRNA (adenine(1618)-N(6))-methyltransferase RlmF [Pseudoalteromonas sp. R96]